MGMRDVRTVAGQDELAGAVFVEVPRFRRVRPGDPPAEGCRAALHLDIEIALIKRDRIVEPDIVDECERRSLAGDRQPARAESASDARSKRPGRQRSAAGIGVGAAQREAVVAFLAQRACAADRIAGGGRIVRSSVSVAAERQLRAIRERNPAGADDLVDLLGALDVEGRVLGDDQRRRIGDVGAGRGGQAAAVEEDAAGIDSAAEHEFAGAFLEQVAPVAGDVAEQPAGAAADAEDGGGASRQVDVVRERDGVVERQRAAQPLEAQGAGAERIGMCRGQKRARSQRRAAGIAVVAAQRLGAAACQAQREGVAAVSNRTAEIDTVRNRQNRRAGAVIGDRAGTHAQLTQSIDGLAGAAEVEDAAGDEHMGSGSAVEISRRVAPETDGAARDAEIAEARAGGHVGRCENDRTVAGQGIPEEEKPARRITIGDGSREDRVDAGAGPDRVGRSHGHGVRISAALGVGHGIGARRWKRQRADGDERGCREKARPAESMAAHGALRGSSFHHEPLGNAI